MPEYVVRKRPGTTTVRTSRPGGVSRVRTRLRGGAGGDASAAIAAHNVSSSAHADLRAVTDDLTGLAPGPAVRAYPAESTVIATHAELIDSGGINLQTWPDGAANGFFTRSGTTYMVAPGGDSPGGDGVMLTEVVANDPTVNRATRKTIDDGPIDATWLGGGGGIHDTGANLYLVTHVEETVNGFGWWYLGMSKSTDDGATWTYLYDLVVPNLDKPSLAQGATIGNGAMVEHDGYLYVFHASVNAAGQIIHLAVTRASVASVEADDNEWATWTGTAWVAGGDPIDLMPATVTHVEQSGFDVIEVDDGWGLIYTDSLAGSAFLYTESLTDWSRSVPQFVHRLDSAELLYRTFWSGDPDHPKRLTDTGTLFVTASTIGGNSRWDDAELVAYTLRKFDLNLPDLRVFSRRAQTAMTYVDGTNDLRGKTPGMVTTTGPNDTIVMPPLADLLDPEYPHSYGSWHIVDGYGGCTVTTADGDTPINFVGDLTLAQGDVAIMFPVPGFLWIGFAFPSVGGATLAGLVTEARAVTPPDGTGNLTADVSTLDELVAEVDELVLGGASTEPTGTPIITRSATRHGSNYNSGSGFGSPMVPYESGTAPSTLAISAGQMYVWGFSGCSEDEVTTLLVETTASSLSAGQQIHIGMFLPHTDLGPGAQLWTTFVTIGTAVQIHPKTGLPNYRRPSEGWVAVLNPSGNAGSVTMRASVPSGSPMFFLGSAVGNRRAIMYPGVASMPSDLSGNSLFNQASQVMSQTAPVILGGK